MLRVRALDANGDMAFGRGAADFLADRPEAVAQNIRTRLGLWTGEWFVDTTQGTPWATQVLGKGTLAVKDMILRKRILQTPGAKAIAAYSSSVDTGRRMSVTATVDTEFGTPVTFSTGSAAPGVGQFDFTSADQSGLSTLL